MNLRGDRHSLNINLHKNQRLIHESSARFKVGKIGRRFGKSFLGIFELIQAAGRYPNETFWYIAPTYAQAKSIAWKNLNDILLNSLKLKISQTELSVKLIDNRSTIVLKGADNPDSLRGPRLKGVVFDEAAYIREYMWTDIVRSQLIDSKGFAYFFSTPKGKNWFTSLHAEAQRKNLNGDKTWESFYYTSYDNPWIEKEEIDKARDTMSEQTFLQEHMAIEQDYMGQKYSEFSFDNNVGEYDGKESLVTVRGIDWGLAHPTVCLWAKVDVKNMTVYISDEYFKSGLTIQENVGVIKDKTGDMPIEWTVIDPSANKRDPATNRSIKDEYARWGIYCLDGDRRERGTDIVKMFLKKGMVKIDPKCRNLIRELQTLEWTDKVGDDSSDCARYLLVKIHDTFFNGNLFEKTIEVKPRQAGIYNINELRDWSNFKQGKPTEWTMEEIGVY